MVYKKYCLLTKLKITKLTSKHIEPFISKNSKLYLILFNKYVKSSHLAKLY